MNTIHFIRLKNGSIVKAIEFIWANNVYEILSKNQSNIAQVSMFDAGLKAYSKEHKIVNEDRKQFLQKNGIIDERGQLVPSWEEILKNTYTFEFPLIGDSFAHPTE